MFKKIFIEKNILDHPRTKQIIAKYNNAEKVICNHYGEIFNLNNQSFRLSKKSKTLIIAKKNGKKLLPTPEGFGIGGSENYYFSHMLNCLYDCRYCFLQGLYNSAHYILFVNYEDFIAEIKDLSNDNNKRYFFSGYDCDSLALENVTNFAKEFLPIFRQLNNSYLELRTKSVNINLFLESDPIENAIIAFSFTPDEISKLIEHKVPPVNSRIRALHLLAASGWNVGVRLDPLIYHAEFNKIYAELISKIFSNLDLRKLHSISVGQLRFPKDVFNKIYNLYPKEKLFNNLLTNRGKLISYNEDLEKNMEAFIIKKLNNFVSKDLIFSCK